MLLGGCTGSPESTFVKMPHCWKSHVAAHIVIIAYCCSLIFKCLKIFNIKYFAMHTVQMHAGAKGNLL